MSLIIFVPGAIAAWIALRRSPESAFLNVYLPVLLLLPQYYRWIGAGVPDPTFAGATILPIGGVYIWKYWRTWVPSTTDFLVVLFAATISYSQFRATGYADAQNLFFDALTSFLFPYLLAKGFLASRRLRVLFAKRLVVLLALVTITQLYEFRFVLNPFRLVFDPFFPGMGLGWVSQQRWGVGRAAGPYGHSILAGIMMATGFLVQRWLDKYGYWPSRTTSRFLTLVLAGGMLMTLSRGPWLGALAAIGVASVLGSRHRLRRLTLAAVLVLVVGIPLVGVVQEYLSAGRSGSASRTQETANYRKELIDEYMVFVMERKAWGWGQNTWPKVAGMPSIDNHFLNLSLRHGLLATGLFIAIVLYLGVRLARHGIVIGPPGTEANLAITLLGVLAMITISLSTVFLGLQAQQLFFLIAGWSEALTAGCPRAPHAEYEQEVGSLPAFGFGRIVT